MEQFRKQKNIEALDRSAAVLLIERILVYRNQRVEIVCQWLDEYQKDLPLRARARQGVD